MAQQWIGYMVSIKCSDDFTYQGEIYTATATQIVLRKAFCNGIPCPENQVQIDAAAIIDLKLIDVSPSNSSLLQQRSTITIAKPIAKRAARTQSTSELSTNSNAAAAATTTAQNVNKTYRPAAVVPATTTTKVTNNNNNADDSLNNNNNKQQRGDRNNKAGGAKWLMRGWRDEECFGSALDTTQINKEEFDFEKNLALFDKQAVWDEINQSQHQRPDVIKHLDNNNPNNNNKSYTTAKYRHDENVIATIPITYRQITVPKQDFCEYVTDDGLIIPSISRQLRKRLWEAADRVGLTWERRIELLGRAAAEMSLQLLGGGHRLNPNNTHQWPTVVVLCGHHRQGAVGLNTARQLASHGVRTIVYCQQQQRTATKHDALIKQELALYALTRNVLVHSADALPSFTDLIILALYGEEEDEKDTMVASADLNNIVSKGLVRWTRGSRAPILALDPPSTGTPGIQPKFSLVPVLPLPHTFHDNNNGKLYLCNLGFPVEIFKEVGITYRSPFGPKFVIPLHPKDD